MLAATGADPAAKYRGTYGTPQQARAVWRRNGFMSTIGDALDGIGLERTQDPQPGDVGVIDIPRRELVPVIGAVMGIRVGNLWAVPAAHGMRIADYRTVTAWRVPWTP